MSTGSVARSFRSALKTVTTITGPVASTSRIALPASSSGRPLFQCTCHLQQKRYSSHPPVRDAAPTRKKRTIIDLNALKRKKIPITMLTAHDYPSARFIESAGAPLPPSDLTSANPSTHRRGVDIALVGDSLAMVACGYPSTTSLTLDEMLYHCRSVARGCQSSLLVADLPFGTYLSVEKGVESAVRVIQEGDMDAVKIEGGQEVTELIQRLSSRGVPVMGHVGLTPQRQASLSGYRVQGKTVASAIKVWQDAQAVQAAGAFAIVLEAVPSRLAAWITQRLTIPTIGIGAGVECDGQVLVQLDMLGVSSLSKGPRFLKKYGDMEQAATTAIDEYVREVREAKFPVEETHGYPMADAEWDGFLSAMKDE